MHRELTSIVLVLSLSLFTVNHVSAQDTKFKRQRTRFTLLNLGVNGIASGLGSMINKKENQRPGEAFLEGLYKGALGGAMIDLGMRSAHLIDKHQQLWLTWPTRFITATGSSMALNASLNKPLFDNLHFNLWFLRLEYSLKSKKFRTRVSPSAIYATFFIGKDGRFNFSRSLETGIIFFDGDNFRSLTSEGSGIGGITSIGLTSSNGDDFFYSAFAHEVVHLMQYERMVWFNAYLDKFDKKLKSRTKLYKTLANYIYFDLNGPAFYLAAVAQAGRPHPCRFLEQEASNFGQSIYYGCR